MKRYLLIKKIILLHIFIVSFYANCQKLNQQSDLFSYQYKLDELPFINDTTTFTNIVKTNFIVPEFFDRTASVILPFQITEEGKFVVGFNNIKDYIMRGCNAPEDEKSIKQIITTLENTSFEPGKIDGKPVTSVFIEIIPFGYDILRWESKFDKIINKESKVCLNQNTL